MTQKRIFLSHRSSQKEFLKARLIPKLKAAGFDYWLDAREIDPLEPITEEIRQAIAESHLFLAWWFDGYEESEPCHFELITALAHCRAEGEHSYQQRVFFAGPDAARDYVEAGIFKGLLAPKLSDPPTEAELEGLVKALTQRAKKIDRARPFGATKLDDASRAAIMPNTNFVGRAKELLKLFGRMHTGRAGTEGGGDTVTLVSGMGGEGKTELAKEFARRFRAWYPGGVYRINLPGDAGDWAASGAALDQALANIADDFGILRPENATRRFVRGRIGEKLTTPYLWLLDDVRGGVSAEDLADFLPPNGHGTCLLTSRAKIDGWPEFDLVRLSPSDGLRLLKRLCPTLADDVAAKLVDHVDGHALALNLIGRGIRSGTDPATFLSETGAALAPLEQVAARLKLGGAKLRPVLATLLTSLSLIPADHFARPLLGLLARLAPAPVPVAFLQQFIEPEGLVPALEWLTTRGLLRETLAGGLDCRRLHPLMAEVVRELPEAFGTGDELAERLTALDGVLRQELQAIIDDAGYFRSTQLAPLLLPHARYRALIGLDRKETTLASDLGQVLYILSDLQGARALQENLLELSINYLGPEHCETLKNKSMLASTIRAQADLAGARTLQEQVLEVRKRTLGPDHLETLRSMSYLASTLKDQGEFSEARVLNEKVFEARSSILGLEHRDTLTSMNNLGNTFRAQGDLPGAQVLHRRAFIARWLTLGPEHPETLRSANNLARILRAQRCFLVAQKLHEYVLNVRRKILVPDHFETIDAMINLARTLRAQGDFSGSRVLEEGALSAHLRILGPEHPDTLTSLNNLAGTLIALKEPALARDLVRPILPLLPTLAHAEARARLTALARHLKLLPPEAP